MNFKKYKSSWYRCKGNRDLIKEETFDAIESILLNNATSAQMGLFNWLENKTWNKWRIKWAVEALKIY